MRNCIKRRKRINKHSLGNQVGPSLRTGLLENYQSETCPADMSKWGLQFTGPFEKPPNASWFNNLLGWPPLSGLCFSPSSNISFLCVFYIIQCIAREGDCYFSKKIVLPNYKKHLVALLVVHRTQNTTSKIPLEWIIWQNCILWQHSDTCNCEITI